jgi:hypothetical protein
MSAFLSAYLPTTQHVLPICPPTCSSARLSFGPSANKFACPSVLYVFLPMPTCLSASQAGCSSKCLSTCLSAYLESPRTLLGCLSAFPSACFSICPPALTNLPAYLKALISLLNGCLSVCPSACFYASPHTCLSACLSESPHQPTNWLIICLPLCMFLYLSTHLRICLPI